MPTVKEDLLNSHRLRRQTWRRQVDRVFLVTGLVGPPEFQLMEAESQPEIPDYLDSYPFNQTTPEYPEWTGLKVTDIAAEHTAPNQARIVVTYTNDTGSVTFPPQPPVTGNDGPDTKSVSFSTAEIETTKDRDDEDMILTPPASAAGWPTQKSQAIRRLVVGQVVFTRVELEPPVARMRDFLGKLNSTSLGSGAYAAETLLFAEYIAPEEGDGEWIAEYRFEYREGGWKHRDVYVGPDGRIPADAVEEEWDTEQTANFSLLNLDWDDP